MPTGKLSRKGKKSLEILLDMPFGEEGEGGGKVRARLSGRFPADPTLQPLRQFVESEEKGLASLSDAASGWSSGIGLKRHVALSRTIQPW